MSVYVCLRRKINNRYLLINCIHTFNWNYILSGWCVSRKWRKLYGENNRCSEKWKMINVDWNISQARRGEKALRASEFFWSVVVGGRDAGASFSLSLVVHVQPTAMHRGRSWNGNFNSGFVEMFGKAVLWRWRQWIDVTVGCAGHWEWKSVLRDAVALICRFKVDAKVEGMFDGLFRFFLCCWESLYQRTEVVTRSWYTKTVCRVGELMALCIEDMHRSVTSNHIEIFYCSIMLVWHSSLI